jgi:choline dehydrogenase-like flavoprotein
MRFARVLIAAGAINSTRLVLESKRIYGQRVLLKSTQGFVMPMLRLRGAPYAWPNANTLSAIFFEFKIPDVSDHWVHCQINAANELVMARFDFQPQRGRLRDRLLVPVFKRLFIGLCNFHSTHAGGHWLTLREGASGSPSTLAIEPHPSDTFAETARRGARRLFRLMTRVGLVPLLPFAKGDRRKPWGWHFGGTLPMSSKPIGDLGTDLLGRPTGWTRIHVVDSSVFPSLPGTTVVLLAMANAKRIADAVDLD